MDTREVLRPYKKQRLGFEGVLIDIMTPNRRNGYTYGLIFGSVYAPNEKVELDHAVIQMDVPTFKKIEPQEYTRYFFTAEIASYYKTVHILGILAQKEHFMLKHINRLQESPLSHLQQPTQYVRTRIHNILLCKGELRHTKQELIDSVLQTPDDGSVEQYINECTTNYQQSYINTNDIIETLYVTN